MTEKNFTTYTFDEVKEILKFISVKKCKFEIKILTPETLIRITNFRGFYNGKHYDFGYIVNIHDKIYPQSETRLYTGENFTIPYHYSQDAYEVNVWCEAWERENPVNLKPAK